MDDETDGGGSIEHRIERGVAVLELRGQYGVVEFRRALERVPEDPAYSDSPPLLLDARGAKVNPSIEEIRAAVGVVAQLRDTFAPHVEIVVSSELHYGLSRVVAAFAEIAGIHVGVHRELEPAWAALAAARSDP